MKKAALTLTLFALSTLAVSGCSTSEQDIASPETAATGAPTQASDSYPSPNAAQTTALLEALSKINPGLSHERNVERARSMCNGILKGKDEATLTKDAKIRFTGGDYTATDADGKAIIDIIKTNGFCVAK